MSSESHREQYIIATLLGFFFGVALESIAQFGVSFAATAILVSLSCFFFRKEGFLFLCVAVLFLFCAFGAWRTDMATARLETLNASLEGKSSFKGVVTPTTDPVSSEHGAQFFAKTEEGQTLVVYQSGFTTASCGAAVHIKGKLEKISNFDPTFDYVSFRKSQGVLYSVRDAQVREGESHFSLDAVLCRARRALLSLYRSTLPEPNASLLGGMVLGTQDGLTGDVATLFRTVGLSHLVVVSGYNITMVGGMLRALFANIRPLFGMWGGILGIILFTLLTGAGSSSVRAAVMAVLALVAKQYGREYDAGRALLFALFVMVLWNPLALLYDISLHLSLLATVGILYLPEKIEPYLTWLPEKFGLREAAQTTLAAQILVTPYILYRFGTFSLVALPVNIIALPIVPAIMFTGIVFGIAGLFLSSLMFIASPILYLLLGYIFFVSRLFAKIPFASVAVGKGSLGIVILLYILIAWMLYGRTGDGE